MTKLIALYRPFLRSVALLAPLFCATAIAAPADFEQLSDNDPVRQSAANDLRAAEAEILPLLDSGSVFGDADKRAHAAHKALALLHRMMEDLETLQAHGVRADQLAPVRFQRLAMLDYFGDEETDRKLLADAAEKDGASSVEASAALALSHWWKAAHDQAAQGKILDEMKALAQANPEDDHLATALMTMADISPASRDLRDAASKIVVDELKSPLAQRMAVRIAVEQKLRSMEGKPLVIAGKTLDGRDFTTSDWKGKVVLVDFWASWCVDCKIALPRVQKAYADYHSRGFEMVGISCDQGAGALHAFLEKNPEMIWPQLFDPAKPGMHEIANRLGVSALPTMFLIDKAGIVRSVGARENFEALIPRMLEEK